MPTHLLEHNAHVKKSASITKEIKTLENRVEYLDRYMNLLALGFASQECQIAQVFDVSPAVSSLLQEKDPQTEQAVPG